MPSASTAGGRLFKPFKQLPFEFKGKKTPLDELGELKCEFKELRIKPVMGALTMPQLSAVCKGIEDNAHIRMLDLDGNMIAMGVGEDQDAAACLSPLIALLSKNTCIKTLDISNNGLPFNEDSMQLALEALVRDTNITGLNIGGNIQVDDALLSRMSKVLAQSQRRWRFLSCGGSISLDAQAELSRAMASATRDAEAAAIRSFFGQRGAGAGAGAGAGVQAKAKPGREKENADPVPAAGSGIATPGCAHAAEEAAGLDESAPEKRALQPKDKADGSVADAGSDVSSSPPKRQKLAGTATAEAASATAPAAAAAACSVPHQPPGASDSRCSAFAAAFNDLREREAQEQLEKGYVFSEITKAQAFSAEEMEYYLWIMQDMNWIMLRKGVVYIV